MNYEVFLDAGHGGTDSGACANGLKEKEMNLVTTLACKEELEYNQVKVHMARTNDKTVSLAERTNMANNTNSKFYVSIHHNAGGGDRGEFIHSIYRGAGETLADNIGNEMRDQLGQQKKVYSKAGSSNKDYYHVIRNTKMSAVIVEVCFIDNATDVQIADTVDEQKRNGRVIAHGILKTLGITPKSHTVINPPTTGTSNLYRVRKSWEDASSQIGAYANLDNAKKNCPSGYKVFDYTGVVVYPIAEDTSYKVKITADVLNVRTGAGTNYKVVTTVKKNEVYTIVATSNGWGRLKSGAGWICLDYTKKC